MIWVVWLWAAPAVLGPAGQTFVLSDFEHGIAGWVTNDAVKYSGKSPDTPLISVAPSAEAHAGRGCLEVSFHPGQGWAGAYIPLAAVRDQWAAAGVDELAFWMRGDGQAKEVKIDIQAWNDQHVPAFYGVPVSLRDTAWHEVVLPLSRFQAANPGTPLRVPSFHAFQIDGAGELGPCKLWVDDLVARNAHGKGAAFSAGPLDARIRALPPVRGLPRLGMWGFPPLTPEGLARARELGLGFGSNGESSLQQGLAFLQGLASNDCPGRPGPEAFADLDLTAADMDQDAQGRRTGEGVESAVFSPAVVDRFCRSIGDRVRARRDAPYVSSFMLSSPISMYGEVHYSASTTGQYAVFSRPAKANLRAWLQQRYRNELPAVAKAWRQPLASWEAIVPPQGPQAGPAGIDTRTAWSDFMHWYNGWLEEVTRRSLAAARAETGKPLAVMMGGPKIGLSQGIALGNIGPIVKLLGQTKPAFFSDTDSQTLFSCRYSRAACSQYGVDLMLEHVGPPYLHRFHQYDMALNVLACGADAAHLAQIGELYDPKHWFGPTWVGLAPLVLRYRTAHVKSDAVLFHSYLTSWYRPDRSNGDCVRLYDGTNTLWYPEQGYPSWGRALGPPDVVDDVMIEDGGLDGRTLLVIPNSAVTVTTRRAVTAITDWVRRGGTVVGFGAGCLAYTIEPDRSLRATPGLAGLLSPGALEALGDDPAARAEAAVGRGRVVLYRTPAADGPFLRDAMQLLEAEADRAHVRRWCRADAEHAVNPMYAGRDQVSGKHLFVVDFTRSVRNEPPGAEVDSWTDRSFDFTFDPSLTGEAELVGLTNSFESCRGGQATFDPASHLLTVQFSLPGTLTLVFGGARGAGP
ncbi:MAG: family 14 glycosylhydrolase [Armatimonadetes bacterium]|nr:family 14 glycosylhydrolase [Armatimonadota bacterium]